MALIKSNNIMPKIVKRSNDCQNMIEFEQIKSVRSQKIRLSVLPEDLHNLSAALVTGLRKNLLQSKFRSIKDRQTSFKMCLKLTETVF